MMTDGKREICLLDRVKVEDQEFEVVGVLEFPLPASAFLLRTDGGEQMWFPSGVIQPLVA